MLGILEYQSHLVSEFPHVISFLIYILIIIIQRAAGGFYKAIQMLDQRGLSRTGMTDDPDKLPMGNRQGNILKRMLFICRSKAVYIVKMF